MLKSIARFHLHPAKKHRWLPSSFVAQAACPNSCLTLFKTDRGLLCALSSQAANLLVSSGGDDTIILKALLLGDSGVGKSKILQRYVDNWFLDYPPYNLPTIGIDFKTKGLQMDDTHVKLQIWDTAGQER